MVFENLCSMRWYLQSSLDFTIEMRDESLTVDEGVEDNTQDICLTLDIQGGGSVDCELTVAFDTIDGTASMTFFESVLFFSTIALLLCAGLIPGKEDFVGGIHTYTISPGTTSGDICFDIEDFIIDDTVLETTEDFAIEVQSINPCGSIGTASTTVVTITDNDGEN